jgi:hypothetical protein
MTTVNEWAKVYYSHEEPREGDVVALGGNPTAVEWTVRAVAVKPFCVLISLRRPKQSRVWEYASRYRLVRRAQSEER